MVEVKFGLRTVDVPYTIHLSGITDEMFDEMVDEDMKAELIEGVMTVYSPATLRDDDVAGFLRALMRSYAADKSLGLVLGPHGLVRINKHIRVGPDTFFLTKDRVPAPLPKEYKGIPDLMLEVVSRQKSDVDWRYKRPHYCAAGAKEIWSVDPMQQEIFVDRRWGHRHVTKRISTGRVKSTALKGFWIEAEWLWTDPLPNEMQCLHDIFG